MVLINFLINGKPSDAEVPDHPEPSDQVSAILRTITEDVAAAGARIREDIVSLVADALVQHYPDVIDLGEVTDATEVISDTNSEPQLALPGDTSTEESES